MKKLMALLVVSGMIFFACNNQPKEEAVVEDKTTAEAVQVEEPAPVVETPAPEAETKEVAAPKPAPKKAEVKKEEPAQQEEPAPAETKKPSLRGATKTN